jgi:2-dehydro-3-deoxygluconokinase
VIDVLCIGETMALVAPTTPDGLETADLFALTSAGAESNVAISIAALGERAGWLSRLGNDPLGHRVLAHVAARGVDVSTVTVVEGQPTGVMFKAPEAERTRVLYYRTDSAASHLSVDDLPESIPPIVHLSGVTAALSASTHALSRALLIERVAGSATISFDVNHRAKLWLGRDAADTLRVLAAAADIVLVGLDEARDLWGTPNPDAVRAMFPAPGSVIVKDAEIGATAFVADTTVFVPSIAVTVVEAVGAGDAFAAGWLTGRIRGLSTTQSLRLAHVTAATSLVSIQDQGEIPPSSTIDALLGLSDDDWSALAFDGASWTVNGEEIR